MGVSLVNEPLTLFRNPRTTLYDSEAGSVGGSSTDRKNVEGKRVDELRVSVLPGWE